MQLVRHIGSKCALALVWALAGTACDSTEARSALPQTTAAPGEPAPAAKFIASSVVFSPEGELTYISVLDSLETQTIDYDRAREFAEWSDVWVHAGYVYVSSREQRTVTRFSVGDDDRLTEHETLSFANHEVDVAFWSNTFVARDKAYMIESTRGYVIWDPIAMELVGTFELPELPEHEPFVLRAGTLDRANVIRDGKLYQPMYWSDEDFALFAPDSRVVVIDIATDSVERVIDAPCAGLDIGAADADGNLYFSTWTGGVFQPLLKGGSANCVAKIAANEDTASAEFTFAGVASGREGAAVRRFRDQRLLMSIFHDERVDFTAPDTDPWALIAELNWRTWLYDPATESAEPVESLDWNSGATYVWPIDDVHYVMSPDTDYEKTHVIALDEELRARTRFELRGWGTRLFKVEREKQ